MNKARKEQLNPTTRHRNLGFWLLVAMAVLSMFVMRARRDGQRQARQIDEPKDPSLVLVTGYCNCGKCCGWKRSWLGFGKPVYNYGKMKGKPKRIGITVTGTRAQHGTIAADPKVYKFGTHLDVPGYGVGTVEDIGGSIKGRHIDVWFPTHAEAKKWGVRRLKVTTR